MVAGWLVWWLSLVGRRVEWPTDARRPIAQIPTGQRPTRPVSTWTDCRFPHGSHYGSPRLASPLAHSMAETLTRLVGDLGLSSRPPSLSPASSTPGSTPIPTPTSVEDVDEQEHEHEHEQDAGEAAGKGKKRRKKLTPAQKRARDEAAAAAAAPRVSSLKVA